MIFLDKKKQLILAISGVKNSGKTTLIEKVIPFLVCSGLKVATIKHDGHDFEPDVPSTDTYKHRKSGAYGVGIFSNNRFMVTKEESTTYEDMVRHFPEADVILLEGFKFSDVQKIEVIRSNISKEAVCTGNVLAYVTDLAIEKEKSQRMFGLLDYEEVGKFIIEIYSKI